VVTWVLLGSLCHSSIQLSGPNAATGCAWETKAVNPANQPLYGPGEWKWVQLITPSRYYVENGKTHVLVKKACLLTV